MKSKLQAIIAEEKKINLMIDELAALGVNRDDICDCINSGHIDESIFSQIFIDDNKVVGM